jgi:hypothetical protein
VASSFRQRVTLSERTKDGLTYTEAFDGREAVDKLAYIIKTTDRNLALLLGRALDSQKFFHDVLYERRLRDSHAEIYRFRSFLGTPSPFNSGEIVEGAAAPSKALTSGDESAVEKEIEEDDLPTGIFTILTDCYSPTCSRTSLCYSIVCPRRLEQQRYLNLKPSRSLASGVGLVGNSSNTEDSGDDSGWPLTYAFYHSILML